MIMNIAVISTSSVSERDRGLAGRPRRGSGQPPRAAPPRAPPVARVRAGEAAPRGVPPRGVLRSRRVAGPVPTVRRAVRRAVDAAARVALATRAAAVDVDDRVDVAAVRRADDDRDDDGRAERAERVV